MKRIYLVLFVLAIAISSEAQKAKFKKKVCSVQKAGLPENLIDSDARTYNVLVKGAYAANAEGVETRLYGWEKDQDNPTAKAVVSIYGFRIGRLQKSSQKKEKKDKDGKVTDKWTEYSYSNTATGLATLYVYGPENKFDYKSKKTDSKQKEKAEAKAEEEKAALEANPFLSSDDVEEAEAEEDIGVDEGLADSELPLYTKINVNRTKEISTRNYRKSSDAYNEYKNKVDQLYDFKYAYPEAALKSAMSSFNSIYGFKPLLDRFYLSEMKSDKHPEYQTWNDAVEATKTLFKTFKFNKSIDEKVKKFDPIVEYFMGQFKSIDAKDKKQKKIRRAAFTNALEILNSLDRHDDAIAICEEYMDDKKLNGVAKRIKNRSEKTKAHLAFLQMSQRHIDSDEEILEGDLEEGELSEDEEVADN